LLNNNTPIIIYINPNARIPRLPGLFEILKYSKMCSIPFSIRNNPAKKRIDFMACIFKGLVITQLLPTIDGMRRKGCRSQRMYPPLKCFGEAETGENR
jgi:hypothetical protein